MAVRLIQPSNPLTCFVYSQTPLPFAMQDIAAVAGSVMDDLNTGTSPANVFASAPVQNAVNWSGVVNVASRFLSARLLPGDVFAVDENGWPIIICSRSILSGAWTLT